MLHTEASTGFGGQEIRIVAEARWLASHGWRVVIAGQPDSPLLAEAAGAGLETAAVRMRGALDPLAFLVLRRLIREHVVDVVHTHSSVDSWLGGLAARSRGVRVVRSRHVSIPIRGALVYRLAHRVITSGDAVADIVAAAGVPRARIVSISPGVDMRRFHADVSGAGVRTELGLRGPTVGLVANVRGSKGHRYFLEAARAVLAAAPSTRFVIVGDGVGFEDVRRRVRELSLDGPVIMTGFRRDIPELMAAFDILVLPSIKSEASSQVIPQALAVGTPVIATTVGGSPELIRDGETGRLVPPADPKALADAMLELLGDPDRARAMARRGQAAVRERLSMDAVMTRTASVYEGVVRGR